MFHDCPTLEPMEGQFFGKMEDCRRRIETSEALACSAVIAWDFRETRGSLFLTPTVFAGLEDDSQSSTAVKEQSVGGVRVGGVLICLPPKGYESLMLMGPKGASGSHSHIRMRRAGDEAVTVRSDGIGGIIMASGEEERGGGQTGHGGGGLWRRSGAFRIRLKRVLGDWSETWGCSRQDSRDKTGMKGCSASGISRGGSSSRD